MKRDFVYLLCFIVPALSEATVHCIDPAGVGGAGCDVIHTAAAEITTLYGGDKVLFRRGHTWNSRILVPPLIGADAEHPVIYGAYGSDSDGAPIIDVQYAEDSAFVSNNKSHLILKDLKFRNSTSNAVHFSNNEYIHVDNVKVEFDVVNPDPNAKDLGNNGIAFANGGGNVRISRSFVTNAPNNGILIQGHATNHISNVTIEHNTITNARRNDCITVHEAEPGETAGSNFLIQGNIAKNCYEQGIDIHTGRNVRVRKNTTAGNGWGGVSVGGSASHVIVEYHKSTDEPALKQAAAILIDSSNVKLLNSVMTGDGYHLLRVTPDANTVEITNNTFVWNGGYSVFDLGGDEVDVRNNIFTTATDNFLNTEAHQRVVRFEHPDRPANHPGYRFTNNVYYSPATPGIRFQMQTSAGVVSFSFAGFKSDYGQEQDNQGGVYDPQLQSRTSGDYHLSAGSPATDAGYSDEGDDVVPAYDHELIPRRDKPEIGAYEAIDVVRAVSVSAGVGVAYGSLEDSFYNDEYYQGIEDHLSQSTTYRDWTFEIPSNAAATLYVDAHYSGIYPAAEFVFSYQQPGETFVDMFGITKTFDDDEYHVYQLPAGISGPITVRASRPVASGQSQKDRLYVDAMFITVE